MDHSFNSDTSSSMGTSLTIAQPDISAEDAALTSRMTRNQMRALKSRQDSTKSELDTVKSELVTVKSELDSTKSELDTIKSELASVKSELDSTKSKLDSIGSKLDSIGSKCGKKLAKTSELDTKNAKEARKMPLSSNNKFVKNMEGVSEKQPMEEEPPIKREMEVIDLIDDDDDDEVVTGAEKPVVQEQKAGQVNARKTPGHAGDKHISKKPAANKRSSDNAFVHDKRAPGGSSRPNKRTKT